MSFKKHISVPEIGVPGEFGEARRGLESGGATQNALDSEIYSEAGLEPEYATGGTPEDMANLTRGISGAEAGIAGLKTAKGKKGRQAVRGQLGAAGIDPSQLGGGGGLKGKLKRYLQANRARQQQGPTITGFKESEALKGQRSREQQLLATEQQDLQKSLSMNEDDVLAADPALAQSLKKAEAEKQQAQVNSFGSLAEANTGTAGAVQNAAFAADRASAISGARRENIGLYQGLQEAQAGQNQDLAAKRVGLAAVPGAMRDERSMKFGQLASA